MKEIGFSTLATRCAIKLEHDKQAKSVKDGGSIVSIVLEYKKEKIMRFLLILFMR